MHRRWLNLLSRQHLIWMRQVHHRLILLLSNICAVRETERKSKVVIFSLLDYVWERVLGNPYVRIVLINDWGQSDPIVQWITRERKRQLAPTILSSFVSIMQRIRMISVWLISSERNKQRKCAFNDRKVRRQWICQKNTMDHYTQRQLNW